MTLTEQFRKKAQDDAELRDLRSLKNEIVETQKQAQMKDAFETVRGLGREEGLSAAMLTAGNERNWDGSYANSVQENPVILPRGEVISMEQARGLADRATAQEPLANMPRAATQPIYTSPNKKLAQQMVDPRTYEAQEVYKMAPKSQQYKYKVENYASSPRGLAETLVENADWDNPTPKEIEALEYLNRESDERDKYNPRLRPQREYYEDLTDYTDPSSPSYIGFM